MTISGAAQGSGRKLLVADDSLTIQKVIRLALSNEGYEIQTVSDGNDAIQQIALFRPDIVLIDVSLPSQSAFEVKEAVDQSTDFVGTRFILMSSAFEHVDEVRVAGSHFHGRLTKPFDPAHLRKVLTDVLHTQPRPSAAEPVQQQSPPRGSRAMPPPPPPAASGAQKEAFHGLPLEMPPLPPPTLDYDEEEGISLDTSSDPLWNEKDFEINQQGQLEAPPALPELELGPPTPDSGTPGFDLDASPALSSGSAGSSDSDIRGLTESTIRMSGLDDFQWSVDERAARNTEPLAFEPPPSLPPAAPQPAMRQQQQQRPAGASVASPSSHEPLVMPITNEQIEMIIGKRVQDMVEKLAQKILPDVAERVIKQEIHKLLTEQL